MPKKESGFSDDAIPGGLTTLAKVADNEYNLLFIDARLSIISTVQHGGHVKLLRFGANDGYRQLTIQLVAGHEDVLDDWARVIEGV